MKRLCMLAGILLLMGGVAGAARYSPVIPLTDAGVVVGAGVAEGGLKVGLVVASGRSPEAITDQDIVNPSGGWIFGDRFKIGLALRPAEALSLAERLRSGEPVKLPHYQQGGIAILHRTPETVTVLLETHNPILVIVDLTLDEAETVAGLLEGAVEELLTW